MKADEIFQTTLDFLIWMAERANSSGRAYLRKKIKNLMGWMCEWPGESGQQEVDDLNVNLKAEMG